MYFEIIIKIFLHFFISHIYIFVKLVQVLPSSESKTLEVPRNAKGVNAVFTAYVVVHVALKPSLEYQRGNRSET